MPKETAIDRARAYAGAGKKPSVETREFIREEMHALKQGTSNHVRSRQQAIAVGLSEARRARIKVAPGQGGTSPPLRHGKIIRPPMLRGKKRIYPIMKSNQNPATAPQPSEDEIRDYASHLFVQHGCVEGHDLENWQEAEACLRAGIPMESTRTRIHHHTQISARAALGLIKHGKS